jgi:CRISPR-associated endonuclease/helicase Cas3
MDELYALWGKTSGPKEAKVTHPLLCHMIDVAEVVGALWDRSLGAGLRARIAETLGCDDAVARRTLMFWAALHDLGKASPAFQRQHPPAVPLLEVHGLGFRRQFGGDAGAWHGVISAWALPPLLERWGAPGLLARDLARGLGGHHGSWPPPNLATSLNRDQYGDEAWDAARAGLVAALAALYLPVPLPDCLAQRPERQALVTLLSGLVSAADWVGSMQEHFPAAPDARNLAAYAEQAAEQAQRAVHQVEWDLWQAPQEPASFETLFPKYTALPMQQAVIDLAPKLDGPSLVLIEAPTGSGKTESALYLADQWACRLQQRGLYIAMPTTSTSNQMHERLGKMLDARYGKGTVTPLLVHSQARWAGPPPRVVTAQEGDATADESLDAMSWFLPRKRSLLAPFGVGTVDQALLSVLLTRHYFVRLFGLAGKTVIFDEVHAYDTYMSTLFARLLGWLRAQGSSVVMLSATLPASTRRELLRAYGAPDDLDTASVAYPAVTWACGGSAGWRPLPAPEDRPLALEWLPQGDSALIETLRAALAEGGCATVLCNTVARSQQVYQTLREAALVPPDDLTLFHSRFPPVWREEIENKVLSRYGKGSQPQDRRGVVVATQVIEQSLDLDFDLMITDLAPMDLLIQRAGRLHRHDRPGRPAPLAEPRLGIVTPANAEALPEWGSDAYVYEPYILLRTWLALQGRDSLHLPSETQTLIEAVYGEDESQHAVGADALTKYREAWDGSKRREESEALKRLVLPVESFRLFGQSDVGLADEDPSVHPTFQALTRWGGEGITVVCLHKQGDSLTLDPAGGAPVDMEHTPSADVTRKLARRAVQVTHRGLVPHLIAQRPPEAWRRHSLLRHYRLAVFADSVCPVSGCGYVMRLSRDLGLSIGKEV